MSLFKRNYYYHQTTKSFITAFGSIFDGISIEKHNSDGTTAQDYVVPIDYSPKNKWLLMLNERPDYTTNQVQITLPRMSFEIIQMTPALQRKHGFNGTFSIGALNAGGRTKVYNPVPYDLTVNLYALTKDNNDMFQIIEQIVPYFQPSLTINLNILPEMNIYKDIPLTLMGVDTQDSFTGSPDEQRTIMSTFTFIAQLEYFGPINSQGSIIKDVKVNITGDQQEKLDVAVNPSTANPTDAYTVTTQWTRS
jgi:hypothetical protein